MFLKCSCLSNDYAVMISRIALVMRNSIFQTRLQRLYDLLQLQIKFTKKGGEPGTLFSMPEYDTSSPLSFVDKLCLKLITCHDLLTLGVLP